MLRIAFGFLSIFPFHNADEKAWESLGRSSFWYPFVGLVIGSITALSYFLLGQLFPRWVSAVLTVLIWVILCGGLHLDGLADCCDGLAYAGSTEKRLLIMKDSHIGTFGVLGLVLTLMLKISCVASLSTAQALLVFPFAASMARWGLIPLAYYCPNAQPKGMAATLKKTLPGKFVAFSGIFPLIPLVFLFPQSILVVTCVCLSLLLIAAIARKQIGGISGDVLGMSVELIEIIVLLSFSALGYTGCI